MNRRHLAALLGTILAAGGLAVTAAPTDAASYSRSSTTAMSVPSDGNVSVPEETEVTTYGAATTIADVNLVLTGLSHTNPDDLDIELVHDWSLGSSGKTAVAVMSDVCGTTDLVSVTLTLDDQAATDLPDASACSTASYQSHNVDTATDSFLYPAATDTLATFNGQPAAGRWSLFVRDDNAAASGGSLAGWTLQVTTVADATIVIPGPASTHDTGAASPYPFPIQVSGTTGAVSDVNLTLPGLYHASPDELDIMLVSPSGMHVIVMSDGCGHGADNATITIDDQAAADLPSVSGACPTGSYRPRNYGDIDAWPAGAGTEPIGTSMSAFNGGPANGTWQLFITDDTASFDTGWILGAPTLSIATDDQAPDTKIKKKPHSSTRTTAKLTFTSSEPGSTFECKVDRKKWRSCGAKLTLKHLGVGKHKVRVRATDAAGNTDKSPARATWRVLRHR